MQADFGEYWMHRHDTRRVKVYFFVAVMSHSRHKFTYFSRTPFTSELAIYARQLAFQFYGGKPEETVYDQDKVIIHSENLGDVVLTKAFQAFVASGHFQCVFCGKSDPQSKGKVENVVKYIKYGFLRGREFTNIGMLNESALHWLARTANGLPHSTTKRIPAEAFKEEQPYPAPYTDTPVHPQDGMKEYLVRKDNTINFHSHFHNVPTGTFNGDGTFVWVCVKDGHVEIYGNETGKMLCRHQVAQIPGQAILDETIQRPKLPGRKELENYILSCLEGNAIVAMWLKADLLAIDDIMLFPVKKEESASFFNPVNSLHEKTPVIITTNKAPTERVQTLNDEVLATAIIDRLPYRCEVIKLVGTSYRLENRKTIFTSESNVNGKQPYKLKNKPEQVSL